ncbi:peptidyl-prolyl cis-trans isomerase [Helicobacter burdigaliensis]|uniref:peptidyl-prolyl cis-trans isomerase n=1 Tax=Helicobacter burdigaliensis TaxID=2315334 RepID=UPI000EF655C4|nr:peptidylprolyl isomerase [Helicobacter burdigaliensis]
MKKIILGSMVAFALMQGVSYAKTFAKVNGEEITEKDIGILMRGMPGVSYEQLPQEAKTQIINQAIERRLLIKQAKKEKIENSKEYKEALALVQDDLALEIWMGKQMSEVKVSDSEIKDFYNKNKKEFLQPEAVKVSHILVKSEAEAKSIIAELKKSGKDLPNKFAQLAKEKSQDPTAQNGGSLGWLVKAQKMVPEFTNAAFKLKKGEYTKAPVKTDFGYHIIYAEDKRSERTLTLDESKARIEQVLKVQKFKDSVQKEGQDLRKSAKIEIY